MSFKLNDKGISTILVVLFLSVALLVLIVSMGNVFKSLNKSTKDFKDVSAARIAVLDIALVINQAYQEAQATANACNPPKSTPFTTSGGVVLCMPTAGFCTPAKYPTHCLAFPYLITRYRGPELPTYVLNRIKPEVSKYYNFARWMIPNTPAMAVPPNPWLPDIPATSPPTLTIAVPDCTTTTGTNKDCIRCDGVSPTTKNATCFKVKICVRPDGNCPTAQYIEPLLAIQTSYGP